MTWLALGALALVVLLLLLRAFADASVTQAKRGLAWFAGALGLVLAGVLILSGRGGQAIWTAVLFGPVLWRWFQGWRAARTFARGGAASPGQESDVATATLEMGLDHDSGRMWGRVRRGRFAGRDLAALDLPELLDLLREVAADDPESGPLLEAWLDRVHPDWREEAPRAAAASGPMTREEALRVLGVAEGATEAEIRAAHRRLMRAAHPDQGGSDWLAARLNEARDRLLGA
jgi:hypothetical protein